MFGKGLWYVILAIGAVAGIVLVIVNISSKRAISKEFISLYRQTDALAKDLIKSSLFDFAEFNKLSSATESAHIALSVLANAQFQASLNIKRLETLQAETVELKSHSEKVSDLTARTIILELMNLLTERNTRLSRLFPAQVQLFQALLASSKRGEPAIPQNVERLAQAVQSEVQKILELQIRIDATYEELLKNAKINEDEELIKENIDASFKNPAIKSPTPPIFFTPTQTPSPTPIPTVTLTPAPTATPTPTASETPTPSL